MAPSGNATYLLRRTKILLSDLESLEFIRNTTKQKHTMKRRAEDIGALCSADTIFAAINGISSDEYFPLICLEQLFAFFHSFIFVTMLQDEKLAYINIEDRTLGFIAELSATVKRSEIS